MGWFLGRFVKFSLSPLFCDDLSQPEMETLAESLPTGWISRKGKTRHQLHRATPSGKALWTSFGCQPKNTGFDPANHPILKIGFSIIFTIHFGGQIPLLLVQHTFDHHLFFTFFLCVETNIHGVQQETTSLIGPVSHLKLDVT